MIWEQSPVAETIAKIIKVFQEGERVGFRNEQKEMAKYRVISYREDFGYLWGIGDDLSNCFFRSYSKEFYDCNIIVIWDGMPPPKKGTLVNTSKYITALDWAVTLSLWIDDEVKSFNEYPKLKILILDLCSQYFTEADSVNFFRQFPKNSIASMPWIRLYRPVVKSDNGWDINNLLVNIVIQKDFTNALHADLTVPSMCDCFPLEKGHDLDIIRRIWMANISRPSEPGDRHAITNLIGSLILLGDEGKDAHVRALKMMMQGVGLLPKKNEQEVLLTITSPWVNCNEEPWKSKIAYLKDLDCSQVNLILVDDMFLHQGWGEVLCNTVGLNYIQPKNEDIKDRIRISDDKEFLCVEASSSAEWLIELLDGNDKRYNLRLSKESSDQNSTDILFLDLRLFSGTDISEEVEFIKKLLELAKKFETKPDNPFKRKNDDPTSPDLPWPGFSEKELYKVEIWTELAEKSARGGERETDAYIKALTFLPRLVALSDLSLPIVLFASTGRREIIEALKPYRNVITKFDKPRFFEPVSYDINIAEETSEKFNTALAEALDFTRVRLLCSKLPKPHEQTEAYDTYAYLNEEMKNRPWKIDLMLDEGEDSSKGLTVGGLLAIYPPGVEPEDIDEKLTAKYASIRDIDGKKFCRDQKDNIAKSILEESRKEKAFVAAVSISGRKEDSVYSDIDRSDELHDERIADNLYRELVRCLIETSIYHFARHIIPHNFKVEFSVLGATRVLYSGKEGMRLVKALRQRWGLGAQYVGNNAPLWNSAEELKKLQNEIYDENFKNILEDLKDSILSAIEKAKSVYCISEPKYRIRSFGYDAVRPLVEEIMREYRGSEFEPTADLARAFRLNSHGSSAAKAIRIMHFFADAILSRENGSSEHIKTLKSRGFHGRYGIQLQTLLKAHRLILHSFLAEGIAYGGFMAIESGKKIGSDSSQNIISFLCQDLYEASKEMNGPEFVELVNMLEKSTVKDFSYKELRGEVTEKYERYFFIRDNKYGRKFFTQGSDCLFGWPTFENIHVGDQVSFMGYRNIIPGGGFCARGVKKVKSRKGN